MPIPLDADLVRRTFDDFRGDWDWRKSSSLNLPLRRWSWKETPAIGDYTKPTPMEVARYEIEYGTLDGRKMYRIVGCVPGTDINGVVVHEGIRD